ncbi:MAG: dTDP-4-dehydrorhamnose 3,5-epimerase family protein [Coriobacteriia bacterium]
MTFESTGTPGLLLIHPFVSRDERGSFTKTFEVSRYREYSLATGFAEEYQTSSARGVVRGMHFQTPPHDHDKVVFCTSGTVFDAVLDLRRGSPTYGRSTTFKLEGPGGHGLYVPRGCAHGFAALSEDAMMAYKVTSPYEPKHDTGILWSSVPGVVWPFETPMLSERDASFPAFEGFESPFEYEGGAR